MSIVAKIEPSVTLSHESELPPRFLDELADTLSCRLADRVANRLLASLADVAVPARPGNRDARLIPDGATHATAAQLAARFQVSAQWVESHAADLGATPISDSQNSKLRYHVATADSYMARRRRMPKTTERAPSRRKPRPTPRTHTRSGQPLLDVI